MMRISLFLLLISLSPSQSAELGQDGFAKNGKVKLHYVTMGKGPVIVLLHGFPDFWYTWRDQMPALAKHFQVVALDLRGYNKSDQPKGVENYKIEKLVSDVDAVRKHLKKDKITVVGHDWGGMIAWSYAMAHPKQCERLVVLNLPHPACLMRELANNPAQHKASAYARNFQREGSEKLISPVLLTFWVKEADAKKKYLEAFRRSSITAMLNYYRANYPRKPYKPQQLPKVKCPVLQIHGMKDKYLLAGALKGTKKYLEGEYKLVRLPEQGHFVHREAPKVVTKTMVEWLTR